MEIESDYMEIDDDSSSGLDVSSSGLDDYVGDDGDSSYNPSGYVSEEESSHVSSEIGDDSSSR